MPLIIPKELPAYGELSRENVFVMLQQRAQTQQIRPLRILILNLMPTNIVTETQLARLLANSPLQVQLTFLQTKTHDTTHTPQEHMKAFYKTFDAVRNERFDGMIITGAPVEQMKFEEVDYWTELREIFAWCESHVTSTLYICWGAQAALHYYYGLEKVLLPKKLFGLYTHKVLNRKEPLVRGFDDYFVAPHSRHTAIPREDIAACEDLKIMAESEEAGVFLCMAEGGKKIFVMGHPEYDRITLQKEYERDKAKGLPIDLPKNYFPDDDDSRRPALQWRAHANTLYTNWLNYYVYQLTPYVWEDDK